VLIIELPHNLGMRIICPICELWLVDVWMDSGTGEFFCLRCENHASKESGGNSLEGREPSSRGLLVEPRLRIVPELPRLDFESKG
jgi:hypothetical protein